MVNLRCPGKNLLILCHIPGHLGLVSLCTGLGDVWNFRSLSAQAPVISCSRVFLNRNWHRFDLSNGKARIIIFFVHFNSLCQNFFPTPMVTFWELFIYYIDSENEFVSFNLYRKLMLSWLLFRYFCIMTTGEGCLIAGCKNRF